MKTIARRLLIPIPIVIAAIISCNKDSNDTPVGKSFDELLTQRQWVLRSFGYDQDHNERIEGAEDNTRNCDRDNTYDFHSNGTLSVRQNQFICEGPIESSLKWKLFANGDSLDLQYATASIIRLNEEELILGVSVDNSVKQLTIFKH